MTLDSNWQISQGWSNGAGLTLLNPQPRSDDSHPYQYVQVGLPRYGGDGSIEDDGLYVDIYYSYLLTTEWTSVLSQCGLSASIASAKVTVYVPTGYPDGTYQQYNGWVWRPRFGSTVTHTMARYRQTTFRVTRLT